MHICTGDFAARQDNLLAEFFIITGLVYIGFYDRNWYIVRLVVCACGFATMWAVVPAPICCFENHYVWQRLNYMPNWKHFVAYVVKSVPDAYHAKNNNTKI
jgi:hypothetical protein